MYKCYIDSNWRFRIEGTLRVFINFKLLYTCSWKCDYIFHIPILLPIASHMWKTFSFFHFNEQSRVELEKFEIASFEKINYCKLLLPNIKWWHMYLMARLFIIISMDFHLSNEFSRNIFHLKVRNQKSFLFYHGEFLSYSLLKNSSKHKFKEKTPLFLRWEEVIWMSCYHPSGVYTEHWAIELLFISSYATIQIDQ